MEYALCFNSLSTLSGVQPPEITRKNKPPIVVQFDYNPFEVSTSYPGLGASVTI